MRALVPSLANISVEEITALEALEALTPEWARLWQRCPDATPFQSPEWLLPLWRQLGEGDLWVICMRRQSRLAGMAPLFIFVDLQSGQRRVLLLGTPIADYCDLLVEPGFRERGAAIILSHLVENIHRWDSLDFQQLRRESPLLKVSAPPAAHSRVTVQEVCPVLELPGDSPSLAGSLPQRMLDQIHRYRRRLEKLGPLALERAGRDSFPELFNSLLELHAARWKKRGQAGVLFDPRLQEFHRESARELLRSGVLRLYGLRSNGCIIGAIYGFAHRAHAYYYLSGFDPEFRSFSPGTVLLGMVIAEAAAEGCATFDFLRGQERYKFTWGARPRLNYRRQFAPA